MKTPASIFLMLLLLSSCSSKEIQPLTGSRWGEIPNPSAEQVASSEVVGWIADKGDWTATHFYSQEAQSGTKSWTIFSHVPKFGRWYTKVNVKPWSTYRFSGWIRTEDLVPVKGSGATFHLSAYGKEFKLLSDNPAFTGTQDWTEVVFEFETDDQDCLVLECLFNQDGQATGRVWFDNLQLSLVEMEDLQPSVKISLSEEKEAMPDYIYGQFIEHLGKCIYGGIWAEMLEDRKFYDAPNTRYSPWKIEGPAEGFRMDTKNPYVGEQSLILETTAAEPVTLVQSGLGIRKGIDCTGRIVMKSAGIESVTLTLSWGEGAENQSQTVISGLSRDYQTYPFHFQSGAHHQNASIKIEPQGRGTLWIGALSLMPDDHIDGFRPDVLALLKELNSPVYRWPGGNFVSGYDWKDGIGDPDKRPPRKNPAWTGVEHNDVGIHEFMKLCELLGTEAYIAVNAGLGGVEEARMEVEYCLGTSETPMGRWRSQNGHPEAWVVKWWSVGNEMYGGWQLGHMSTEQFVAKHNAFAQAMWSVNPDIKLIAVGDPGPWDEMILANCSDNMNYISEHFYRQDWHGGGLMTHARQIPDAIRERAKIHRKYREEIPALQGKDIRICMDEWNYWYGPHIYGELGTRYYMRDALGIAAGINEFSRQSDIIFMANYAQTVNVIGAIKTNSTQSVLAATGQALKMYRQYFGSIPLTVSGDSRPLDIAASLTNDRQYLTISVVNLGWESKRVKVDLGDLTTDSQMEIICLEAPDDMSFNEPGQAEKVRITTEEQESFEGFLEIPGIQARIYRLKLQ